MDWARIPCASRRFTAVRMVLSTCLPSSGSTGSRLMRLMTAETSAAFRDDHRRVGAVGQDVATQGFPLPSQRLPPGHRHFGVAGLDDGPEDVVRAGDALLDHDGRERRT